VKALDAPLFAQLPQASASPRAESEVVEARKALSFREVYDDHFDFVWRTVRRLGIDSGVDDVVQEVFLTIHQRLPTFEHRSSLKTWVFAITRRIVSTHLRTKRRRRENVDRLNECAACTGPEALDPERQAARSEAVAILHQILDHLDDQKREVFVLAELERMSISEIASALEINVHTAQWRLKAARQAFEAAVQRLQARQRREDR
jgi:RNA polymerase sigma-70 factor, ECF subfamily